MEMIAYLEADREKLRQALLEAGTPEQAEIVVESEIDRLLLQYNESCGSERERDAALQMMQAAKSMLPMLSAQSEPKIWERSGLLDSGAEKGAKMDVPAWIALIAGAVLCATAPLAVMAAGGGIAPPVFLKTLPFALAGGALLFLAGRRPWNGFGSRRAGAKAAGQGKTGAGAAGTGAAASSVRAGVFTGPDRQIELRVDADRIWSCLRAMVMVVDRNMKDLRERMEAEKRAARAAEADGGGYAGGYGSTGNGGYAGGYAGAAGKKEIRLLSDLLELAYSQRMQEPAGRADKSSVKADIQTAEEMIDNIRFYLHEREIEAVDFSAEQQREHADWFERLPAFEGKTVTLRPALVQDGRLLRKGLAAVAG